MNTTHDTALEDAKVYGLPWSTTGMPSQMPRLEENIYFWALMLGQNWAQIKVLREPADYAVLQAQSAVVGCSFTVQLYTVVYPFNGPN